jgi:cation-transporting P-type ATPase 13A2
VGRTLPYPRIYTKRPTASLVSKKVLASIVGQIVVTSAVQLWTFLWVRDQEWYSPPVLNPDTDGNQLSALNYENSALFLVSCFQYILVAAVFSIGPPYRKPIWTNGLIIFLIRVTTLTPSCPILTGFLFIGWLMLSLVTLSAFNIMVLLRPPQAVADILELMPLPSSGRFTLLATAAANVILSVAFERWGAPSVARVVGWVLRSRRNSRGRVREGKIYKAVEGGMR